MGAKILAHAPCRRRLVPEVELFLHDLLQFVQAIVPLHVRVDVQELQRSDDPANEDEVAAEQLRRQRFLNLDGDPHLLVA